MKKFLRDPIAWMLLAVAALVALYAYALDRAERSCADQGLRLELTLVNVVHNIPVYTGRCVP